MQIANDIFFAEVERMLAEGHEVRFRIKGHSMRPLLRDGRDTVVLAPCRAEESDSHTANAANRPEAIDGHTGNPTLHSSEAADGHTESPTPCRVEALRTGDIVLFRYRGRHILHRIVRIDGDRLTLEGDGNYHMQEHCMRSDVLAVARQVIRPGGRIIACSSTGWQLRSRAWRALPPLVRRYALSALFKLGYK